MVNYAPIRHFAQVTSAQYGLMQSQDAKLYQKTNTLSS